MREMKFRAWNEDAEAFEFLHLIHSHTIITSLPIPSMGKWEKLKPFQQFTGLKDKNGKEIYEGDFLELKGGDRNPIGEVIFEYGCFCFKADWIKEGSPYPELKYYTIFKELPEDAAFKDVMLIEIIGNIYESAEIKVI